MENFEREREMQLKFEEMNSKINQLLSIVETQQGYFQKTALALRNQDAKLDKIREEMEHFCQNIRYEMNDNKDFEEFYWYPKIMDHSLTIHQIVNQKKSYARLTETELDLLIMDEKRRENFSVESEGGKTTRTDLREKLSKMLMEENDKLCIAVPDFFGSLDVFKEEMRRSFRNYLSAERRIKLRYLLPQHKNYHDALMMHPDKFDPVLSGVETKKRFESLKPIWQDRDIVTISVDPTYLANDNPLFDNAKSMGNMEVPMTDTLLYYNDILSKCLEQSKDTLFLIAAGPMGVAMVADLCKSGYQALDVGTLGKRYLREV